MHCPNCKTALPDNSVFCPGCGSPLAAAPVAAAKKRAGPLVWLVPILAVLLAVGVFFALWFSGALDRPEDDAPALSGREEADNAGLNDAAPGSGQDSHAPPEENAPGEDRSGAADDPGETAGGTAGAPTDADAPGGTAAAAQFENADAVVEAYLSALGRDDLDGVLETCALEEYLEYGDWQAYTAALRLIQRGTFFTDGSPLMEELFLQQQEAAYVEQLFALLCSLLAEKSETAASMTEGMPVVTDEAGETAAAFDELLRSFSFRDAEILGFAENALTEDERGLLADTPVSAALGRIDAAEYLYLLRYDQRYYVGGLTVYEYESGWKVGSLTAQAAGLGYSGFLRLDELDGLEPEDAVDALLVEYSDRLDHFVFYF